MDLGLLVANSNISIAEAMKMIDKSGKRILFITEGKKLVGSLSDGDIRRYILKSGGITGFVYDAMNKNPIYSHAGILKKINGDPVSPEYIECVPVTDEDLTVTDVLISKKAEVKQKSDLLKGTPVVIMAGGEGTRLYPYTKILPKPLIPIGEHPIIEHIISRFTDYGAVNFIASVNYKQNLIRAYFADITKEYNIDFIDEDKPLGTAGSLHLLKGRLNSTFFVSNCDILINADYADILTHHKKNNNLITVVTSLQHFKIPYGVIEISGNGQICDLKEKPEYNFLVNTGLYILEPEALEMIPQNKFYHITQLIEDGVGEGKTVGVYPVSADSYMDMGQFDELENMRKKLGLD